MNERISLTEQERDAMAHAIGHHSAKGCSVRGGRNYYAADVNDPLWLELVTRGLAVRGRSLSQHGEAYFHVTDEGIAAVERDPRSQRKGRLWTIKFKNYENDIQIYAETRGKAKYKAVRDMLDCWNMTTMELFRCIASCRLEAR